MNLNMSLRNSFDVSSGKPVARNSIGMEGDGNSQHLQVRTRNLNENLRTSPGLSGDGEKDPRLFSHMGTNPRAAFDI